MPLTQQDQDLWELATKKRLNRLEKLWKELTKGGTPSVINNIFEYITPDSGESYYTLYSAIEFIIDGGGAVITTGQKGHLEIPFDCTITQIAMLADQSGSIVVDIWKDTYANFPPTVADTIVASAKPTITTAVKSQDLTLTGWTTAIAAGDILAFTVDSVTSIQRLTLALTVRRT